ncbi:MAG: fibronectin type III domain-containing protein, partial [Bacteroidales bacterium]|nr:fibronectin type III domain-containing protein [Bacteroidales bacterium]
MKKFFMTLALSVALLLPWAMNAQLTSIDEGFDGGSIPAGWTAAGTMPWTVASGSSNGSDFTGAHSGSGYVKASHNTSNTSGTLTSPTIDLSGVTAAYISFWYTNPDWSGDQNVLVVKYSTDGGTTWTTAGTYGTDVTNWTEVTIPIPATDLTSTFKIQLEGQDHYGYAICVDDLFVGAAPTCPAVASINLEEATTESLTVSWIPNGSENSWLVTCGEDAVVVSDTTYTFYGLDGATAYEITVAALCADGDTSRVKSEVFRTTCPAAVENYSEDFEGFATDEVPDCWQVITHASSYYYPNPCISVDANHAHNGSGLLSLYDYNYSGNAINLIATPRVADISTRQLNFWAKTQSGANPTRFVVGLVNNANAFIPVDTLSLATTYNYFTVNFTDFSDYDTMRIGFMAEKLGGSFHVDIDEVSIIDLPNCLTPSGLAAIDSTLTPNDIELVWNEEGTATAWNIAYSTSPIGDFDTISPESVSYMPYMISNLNPATQYYFYIQADCGGETSPWSPAYVKTTPVCSVEEMCSIRFDMVDSYGDGWNGNGIRVKQGAFVLGEVTIASGSSDSAIVRICPNDTVVFEWISGSYASEVSFNIYDAFGELIYSCTDATSFANGQQIGTFVTSCEAPDCARPMNVVFQSATTSSMTIAWSEMGEATTWNVVWDTQAITDFSNYNATAAYSNPFTITGLDSNTTYYVYVQADCGGAESEWSAPLVAKTSMCDDNCDINVVAAGSTYWWGTSYAASAALIQGGNTIANITSAGEYQIPVCAGDSISIVFTSNGGSDYASYVSLNITDAWDVLLYDKPAYSSVTEDAPAAQIATSCVAPTCVKPKFVTFSDITLNDVTVHWFDTIGAAWTVEYGVAGFTPGNGTVVNASADSIQLTGLTPGTRYAVYVTPTCDNTLTSDVAYFATSCAVVTAVPFAENFNTYASGDVPTCWTATQTYVDYADVQLPAVIAGSYDSYDGSALLEFYGQSESIADTVRNTIALPEFASLAGLQLEFLGMGDNWNITDELYVGVLDTADNFVALDTLHLNGTFELYTIVLDRYDTLSRRVAFSASGAGYYEYYYFYIDNIVIDSVPSCFRPEAFAVTGTAANSVTLSWNEVGQATSWQIAYDTVALNPADCANFETVTTNPCTVTNVVPGVPYTFWVRSICGAGDTSEWCINSVSGAANTWTMHANQTDTITLCGGIIYDCGGPNGTYENDENSTLIILPDVPTNTVRLQGNYNTESNYDKISIYEGVGTSGTCLLNQASGIGTVDYTSTAIGGALTLVFTSDLSAARDGFAFSVSCVSNTCPMVVDLHVIDSTITSGSFDIDWTEAGTAAQWEVVVAEGGNDITTGFSAVTTSHPYTVNGLNALSAYDVYVRPICSATDTGDWKSITVGTGMCEDGTTIVLGDDSNYVSNLYAPAYSYYNYSYSQTLIKADVLAGLEDGIGAFEFYMGSNSGGDKMANTQIYMGHVADSNLSGGAIAIDTTFVKVFDGELAYTQGWNRFSFTQKFDWDGQSNVLIVFDRNAGSYASGANTRVTSTTDVMTLYTYSDSYNIDPANPDSYTGTIYDGNWVPVYHFFACPESGSCARPIVTNVTNDHSNATITWTASGNNFEIELKPATQGAWADQPVAVQGLTYTFAGLTPETAYQFRLRQVCDDANTSAWVMGSFTTDSLPCFAPSAVTATPAGTSVDLNWTNGG